MSIIQKLLTALTLTSVMIFAPLVTAELPSPKQTVQQTLDDIVAVVTKNKGDENKHARRNGLRSIMNPKFDFAKMAQLSLGTNWNTIDEDQQKEFVDVFSNLLSKTYMAKVETVEPGMITVESERIEEGNVKAVVKTLVKSKGDYFPIDYRLVLQGDTWRVYDVVIENIGLVVNYRNEFASIVRKDKFSGLMEQLRKKSAE
jgi:phospholipid transport system substrate-binding protein